MKRSKQVELVLMLAASTTLGACDGSVDDRTAQNVQDQQNIYDQKKPKITCNKPEDFSLPECHDPKNFQGSMPTPVQSGGSGHGSAFIYVAPGHSNYYGPHTPASSSYSAARTSIGAKTYIAPTVSRGGFGATGRGFAASAAVSVGE